MTSLQLLLVLAHQTPTVLPAPPRIEDNSFLVEEAYNQEVGVVQHASAFQRLRDGSWAYTFTQEWPFFGQANQVSYEIPVLYGGGRTGFGDVALNYRRQLVSAENRIAVAGLVSFLVPTGDEHRGFGSGTAGVFVNLPVSVRVNPHLSTHLNLGATGVRGESTVFSGGASAIWLTRSTFNVLLEFAWSQVETDIQDMFVSPGIRWAYNFKNGLQIVPGIAVPIGLGPSSGERHVFLYLSFEHPF